MRRSLDPGMRYPCRAPESTHLLTVRGATLQILATSPVVSTSFTLVVVLIASSPSAPHLRQLSAAGVRFSTANIVEAVESFRVSAPILRTAPDMQSVP